LTQDQRLALKQSAIGILVTNSFPYKELWNWFILLIIERVKPDPRLYLCLSRESREERRRKKQRVKSFEILKMFKRLMQYKVINAKERKKEEGIIIFYFCLRDEKKKIIDIYIKKLPRY
jgi:hypothetical protein